MKDCTLIIGSSGQIGTELVIHLREIYGNNNVIASDIINSSSEIMESGPFELLDVMDKNNLYNIIHKYKITHVYLLAAMLSATAEKNIELGWRLNMRSLSHILDLAKNKIIKKVFWPSSIAVFGPNTPKILTPQHAIMDPTTVYGISKQAGERWCEYYYKNFNVDIRSLRYPGLIGWKSSPGGGTTDYAVHIFHEAIKKGSYKCFIDENTSLPMMYMKDSIRATVELMEAPFNKIKIRSSYNLSGVSFSPKEIANEILKHIPNFEISYHLDFRENIALDWPKSIDDTHAKNDWGWNAKYDLEKITSDMIKKLQIKYKIPSS